LGSTT